MTAMIDIENCPICGESRREFIGVRYDGVSVVQCNRCKMGYVALRPEDTSVYYDDTYYAGDQSSFGYENYDYTASFTLGWVARFAQYLVQAGHVLDVGCADGFLLSQFDSRRYERFGVEVNRNAAKKASDLGINIIGYDIEDHELTKRYSGMFDLVIAIAVLEHVPHMLWALYNIAGMLAPNGILLIETPLISRQHSNAIWFHTSLEHIYYPTLEGIDWIINKVFGRSACGREVFIEGYGSTFVGVIGASSAAHEHAARYFERFIGSDPANTPDTDEEAARFRLLFDALYAANVHRLAALLPVAAREPLTPYQVERLLNLWLDAARRVEHLEQELINLNTIVEDLRSWVAQEESARDYHAQQAANWQRLAEERAAWIRELETARDYHAQQAANWQAEAQRWQAEAQRWQAEAQRWQAELESQRSELERFQREYMHIPRSRAALRRLVRRKQAKTI